MDLMDLVSIWQHISAAFQAWLQPTTNDLIALTAFLLACAGAIAAVKKVRTSISGKPKSTPRRKAPAKRNPAANSQISQVRTPRTGLAHDPVNEQGAGPTQSGSDSRLNKPVTVRPAPSARAFRASAAPSSLSEKPYVEPRDPSIPLQEADNYAPPSGADTQPSQVPSGPQDKEMPPLPEVETRYTFPWEQNYEKRKPAANALTAITNLVRLAHNTEDVSNQKTRSLKLYARHLRFLVALADTLRELHKYALTLDTALDELQLPWEDNDPRASLFSYLDPFATYPSARTPDDMRRVYQTEAERIAAMIEVYFGFSVERKPENSNHGSFVEYRLAPPGE